MSPSSLLVAISALLPSRSLPGDLAAAFGGGKQRMYLIPSLQLVVVRLGTNSQGFSDVEFLSLLLRGKTG